MSWTLQLPFLKRLLTDLSGLMTLTETSVELHRFLSLSSSTIADTPPLRLVHLETRTRDCCEQSAYLLDRTRRLPLPLKPGDWLLSQMEWRLPAVR
jgi:hypothetical protein